MAAEIHKIAEINKKNFESKIREYAGPRMDNGEWVRVYCILKTWDISSANAKIFTDLAVNLSSINQCFTPVFRHTTINKFQNSTMNAEICKKRSKNYLYKFLTLKIKNE